jgi:hypothetical protein
MVQYLSISNNAGDKNKASVHNEGFYNKKYEGNNKGTKIHRIA